MELFEPARPTADHPHDQQASRDVALVRIQTASDVMHDRNDRVILKRGHGSLSVDELLPASIIKEISALGILIFRCDRKISMVHSG